MRVSVPQVYGIYGIFSVRFLWQLSVLQYRHQCYIGKYSLITNRLAYMRWP